MLRNTGRRICAYFIISTLLLALFGCAPDQAPPPPPSADVPASGAVSPALSASPSEGEVLGLDPAVIPGFGVTAEPAPAKDIKITKVTVTFNGDATTSRGFTWYTEQTVGASDLEVAVYSGETPDFSQAVHFTGTASTPVNSPKELVHKAVATGLQSDTVYWYRLGDRAADAWSSPARFKTAPESGAFTFIDVSDTQMNDEQSAGLAAAVLSAALKKVPDAQFMIHNGDFVDDGSERQWNWLLNSAASVFGNTTLMPVAGNHEAGNNQFIDHFSLNTVTQDTSKGAYYSVDYSNAHFVVLNTNEGFSKYAEFSDAQLQWIREDIDTARSAGAEWIIVVLHKAPFTTTQHIVNQDIINVRKQLVPLLTALGVDLVLQGHDHMYVRTHPILDAETAEQTIVTLPLSNLSAAEKATVTAPPAGQAVSYFLQPKGPVYLTPGTAGEMHFFQKPNLTTAYLSLFSFANGPYYSNFLENPKETFVSITINGNQLTSTAYALEQSAPQGEPSIIDSFGIIK